MTEWHPLDSYYIWCWESESIKKYCIYSKSHFKSILLFVILYYINDAIQNSSRYYDTSSFRDTFKNLTNTLSIVNANIRGMRTNMDDFKVLPKNLNYTFPIIGVTETWLKPHKVENFYLENYSHEFDIRHKKTGGRVSLFLTSNMVYSRRNDIIFNSEINSVTVDIAKREINGQSNI